MLFSDAIINYKNRVSIHKRGFKNEVYKLSVIDRSILSNMNMKEIKSHHIAEYRDFRLSCKNPKTQKPITPSTVIAELNLISHIFDIAIIEWGVDAENPCRKIRRPKPNPPRTRRLSPREEKLIFTYASRFKNPELKVIVILAIETGMRMSELLGLTNDDVNLKRKTLFLKLTKNGESREVALTDTTFLVLKKFTAQAKDGNLFSYTSGGLKTAWRKMVLRLGIKDLRFHDLRHEAISRMFENHNLSIVEASAQSGHKTLSQLKRYTHIRTSEIVKKLGKAQNKAHQAVIQTFCPYPVLLTTCPKTSSLSATIPDFKCSISKQSHNEKILIEKAKSLIVLEVLRKISNGQKVPKPDSYTENFKGRKIFVDASG